MALGTLDYAALYEVTRLPVLDAGFEAELRVSLPELAARFEAYRAGATLAAPAESALLIELATVLEDHLARSFGVEEALAAAHAPAQAERVIHSFRETFVRPRAKRPGDRDEVDF